MNPRRALVVAVLVLAVPVLAACSVSFGAQTDQLYNPAVGVNNRSGSVDVLNAVVVSGTDGSGTVVATLVNNDQARADSLRSVAGAGSDASLTVTPGGSTTIAPAGLLNLAKDGNIVVRGSAVVPGYVVKLTFSFARGRSATLQVPVVSADDPAYRGVKVPS